MWGAGFHIRNGWNASILFTGGNQNILADLFVGFASMISLSGIYTLLGYLFTRWWKQILILFAVGVAAAIIFATQIRIGKYLPELRDWLEWFILWLFDVAIPAIEAYFSETRPSILSLRYLATGVAATLLSYPIMRGMKVVK